MIADLDLEAWLADVREDRASADYSFPSDRIRDKYLETVEARPWHEVIGLLQNFLLPSCSLGCDPNILTFQNHLRRSSADFKETTFTRRLLAYAQAKHAKTEAPPPWEGITWVLDLLPDHARLVLQVLDAYAHVHLALLPDGRIHGLFDTMEVIRAACIRRPNSEAEAIALLLEEPPRTFERIIERLYDAMGYETTLTPRTNDGGFDILVFRKDLAAQVSARVECKRWKAHVGVPQLRALLGVVADAKATNGVCVTTGDFTRAAKSLIANNARLKGIAGHELIPLLNEYLGPRWFTRIERLVLESQSRNRESSASRAAS
jgi:restriction system protein